MTWVYTLLILFSSANLSAYIPRTETIVRKVTANNGRSDYKITREVTLEAESQQVRVRETWLVANGDLMKLTAESLDSSNPWKFSILYKKSERQTLSASKSIKRYPRSPDFFESIFHDRYYKSLMGRLIHHNFLPAWVKDVHPPTVSEKGKTEMVPEPFISLEPIEGSVSYAIGAQQSSSGDKAQTKLWIEQDSFVVKKGKLSSGAEFVNDQFQSFPGGLQLPSSQIISWGDRVAKVKLLEAETIKTNKNTWPLDKKDSGSIPSDPLVKEFYSRFR